MLVPSLVVRRRRPLRFPALLLAASIAVVGAAAAITTSAGPAPARPPSLPDPEVQARAATGAPPATETVRFWQQRVEAAPDALPDRKFLARALMTQAAESGDLSLYETAETQWREALRISPRSADARLGLGSARAAQHDFATTAQLAEQVLAEDPRSVSALIALGDAQFELGNYPAARATYRQLAARIPGTGTVFSRQARLAALDGDAARAVELVRAALVDIGDLDLKPADAAFFWFQLASYELGAGRVDAAARHLTQGLRVDARHLPSLELLARVRAEQGRLSEARHRYERLVATTPAADLYGLLAKVERATGHVDAARSDQAEGLALGRGQLTRFPAERRHLAGFFADADPAAALDAARTDYAQRQDIQSAGILAWAEFRTGDVNAAVGHSREALRFGTADAVLRIQGGLIEAAAHHDARARTLLRAGLAVRPHYDLDWAPRAAAALDRLERRAR